MKANRANEIKWFRIKIQEAYSPTEIIIDADNSDDIEPSRKYNSLCRISASYPCAGNKKHWCLG